MISFIFFENDISNQQGQIENQQDQTENQNTSKFVPFLDKYGLETRTLSGYGPEIEDQISQTKNELRQNNPNSSVYVYPDPKNNQTMVYSHQGSKILPGINQVEDNMFHYNTPPNEIYINPETGQKIRYVPQRPPTSEEMEKWDPKHVYTNSDGTKYYDGPLKEPLLSPTDLATVGSVGLGKGILFKAGGNILNNEAIKMTSKYVGNESIPLINKLAIKGSDMLSHMGDPNNIGKSISKGVGNKIGSYLSYQ